MMMTNINVRPSRPFSSRQRGSALGITLIFLLLLTLLGVSAMQGSSLQERMAGNLRDRDLAFQGTEAALREAEIFLQNPVLPSFNSPAQGLVQPIPGGMRVATWNNYPWGSESAVHDGDLDAVAEAPRYVIEELPPTPDPQGSLAADEPIPDINMYRITARGVGGTSDALVILQSTFRR